MTCTLENPGYGPAMDAAVTATFLRARALRRRSGSHRRTSSSRQIRESSEPDGFNALTTILPFPLQVVRHRERATSRQNLVRVGPSDVARSPRSLQAVRDLDGDSRAGGAAAISVREEMLMSPGAPEPLTPTYITDEPPMPSRQPCHALLDRSVTASALEVIEVLDAAWWRPAAPPARVLRVVPHT
jgi:hypothetical protein